MNRKTCPSPCTHSHSSLHRLGMLRSLFSLRPASSSRTLVTLRLTTPSELLRPSGLALAITFSAFPLRHLFISHTSRGYDDRAGLLDVDRPTGHPSCFSAYTHTHTHIQPPLGLVSLLLRLAPVAFWRSVRGREPGVKTSVRCCARRARAIKACARSCAAHRLLMHAHAHAHAIASATDSTTRRPPPFDCKSH